MATIPIIDLAHEPGFRIGNLSIRPAIRQLSSDDGGQEVLEPRVMQVLVALAKDLGAIRTRDELTEACWDGRVVGEDAINRVISRLRRVAEGIAAKAFRIETITKVGYRLVPLDAEPDTVIRADEPKPSRRGLMVGALSVAVGITGLAPWLAVRPKEAARPPEALRLIDLGRAELRKGDADSNEQAIALFGRATRADPRSADAWGLLALATSAAAKGNGPGDDDAAHRETLAALGRAEALDARNPYALQAAIQLLPDRGAWQIADERYRAALRWHPDSPELLFGYSQRLFAVGRVGAAVRHASRSLLLSQPSPFTSCFAALMLWSDGQPDVADAVMHQGSALFPLHFAVWFTRFYLLVFTGRADQALRFVSQRSGRPHSLLAEDAGHFATVARAFQTSQQKDIDQAIQIAMTSARLGSGHAEFAMQQSAALGRVDDAFAIAEGYYLNCGFIVPDRRFPMINGARTTLRNRRTNYLFHPSTAPMRRDPRFAKLVDEIGLQRYWRDARVMPDYLRQQA